MSPGAAIEQPLIDKRAYRFVRLDNGLRIIVCSDPDTDKSAAAFNVHVGSFSDPIELPGLAHYVEHMMSHGSTKYPDEAHYKQLVSQFGGTSNACTSAQHTSYRFSVNHPNLETVLDVFAQFFICPLMDESAADREVNAVDSEHQKNVLLDSRRGYYLLKEAASEDHPFSRFSTGNLETLRDGPRAKGLDVRAALVDFHSRYYSGGISTLGVIGREPADVLESWVRRMFAPVPDMGVQAPAYGHVQAFEPSRWNQRLEVVPVKDIRKIEMAFLLPPQAPHYRSKPARYATHLTGHEGAGSLLSMLKARGWADALSASASDRCDDFATLTVSINLTKAGEGHVDECVEAVFAYWRMLRAGSVQRWIFDEIQRIADFRFAFQDKSAPYSYAEDLAERLHEYPPEHVLAGPYRLWAFEPEKVESVLAALVPTNLRLTVTSKRFEGTTSLTGRWYGTPFNAAPLDPALIQRWSDPAPHPELRLPDPNPYIATDFAMLPPDPDEPLVEEGAPAGRRAPPRCILDTPAARLFYKRQSSDYEAAPKAVVTLQLLTPEAYHTPEHAVLTRLFADLLEDALTENAYPAEVAGLSYDVSGTLLGLKVSVGGYSHKLPLLLAAVVQKLAAGYTPDDRFGRIREIAARQHENALLDQPREFASYTLGVATDARRWHLRDLIPPIHEATAEDVAAHGRRLLRSAFVECLVVGNLTVEAAQAMLADTLKAIGCRPLPPALLPERRMLVLPAEGWSLYAEPTNNASEANSACLCYYQVGERRLEEDVRLELLARVMDRRAHFQLRTQEQLGYMVSSGVRRDGGVQGLVVSVQSAVRGPRHIDSRIAAFLLDFARALGELPEAELASYVENLVANKLEKDRSVWEESRRWWGEISGQTYEFDRVEREVAALRAATRAELEGLAARALLPASPSRRKLSVHVASRAHAAGDGPDPADLERPHGVRAVQSLERWRRELPAYPVPYRPFRPK